MIDGLPEESAEELYEEAPCGYLSTLPGGEIVRVNRTFLDWTGYAREELVGRRRFQELLSAGGRIYHETHFAPLLQMHGEAHEIALDVVCASGRRLPVLVTSVLKRDASGRPQLVRTTVFNAGDRRRYERELLAARDAERSARERTERLQRLTAALAAPLHREGIAAAVAAALVAEGDGGAATAALAIEEDGVLAVVAQAGGHGAVDGSAEQEVGADAWLDAAAAVLRTGDARYDEHADAGGRRWAVVVAPLVVDGRAIGVLRASFDMPHALDDADRAYVAAVAAQTAQAVERAGLLAGTRQAASRAALLAEVSRALDETNGFAARTARLVELLVPGLADTASVAPEGTETGSRAAARALSTRAPQLAVDSVDGRSRVALPLVALGRRFGVLVLTREDPERRFRAADLPFLADLADRAALALENARLYEQQRDVSRILQRSLLAGSPPRDDRFAVATYYRPAVETFEVGGDWHDCFMVGEDRAAIAVGDVVGRGIEAAAAMGQLRSAIRALAGARLSPGAVLDRLDTFAEHLPGARYATVAYAEVALDTGAVDYACAGHPPPLLLAPGGPPVALWDGRSQPIAANFSGTPRGHGELTLAPGARLLLYTDGLVERRTQPIDEGLARLADAFAARRAVALPELVGELTGALLPDFTGEDDVCLLCFELRPASPP